MLNVATILSAIVCDQARADFRALYASENQALVALVTSTIDEAFTSLASSDALYHNVEHTSHVTLVGLEILKAKQLSESSVSAATWTNVVIALVCHDIGYVRQLDAQDCRAKVTTGIDGQPLEVAVGSSDAVLMPVHVNRGKRYVEQILLSSNLADIGVINACIERTRFPVPDDAWYAQTDDFPGLVRAADLIGQLSDPRYLHKLPAIFYEFEETGFNRITGYQCPGDLLLGYPAFYANSVVPYIDAATEYLKLSVQGQDILAHLEANLTTAREAVAAPLSLASGS